MAMGMMTEYYHFIFTTLVTYLWVLARVRVGSPQNKVSQVGTVAAAGGDSGWPCFLRLSVWPQARAQRHLRGPPTLRNVLEL